MAGPVTVMLGTNPAASWVLFCCQRDTGRSRQRVELREVMASDGTTI
jgi:hypothetical protein